MQAIQGWLGWGGGGGGGGGICMSHISASLRMLFVKCSSMVTCESIIAARWPWGIGDGVMIK